MKVLFVSDDAPMSGNCNGAASYKFSHLQLLLESLPGADFTLLSLISRAASPAAGKDPAGADELEKYYPGRRFKRISLDLTKHPASAFRRRKNLISSSFHRLSFFFPLASRQNIFLLGKMIGDEKPDLIWTEQLFENFLVQKTKTGIPVVYSQTDFIWKIRKLRQQDMGAGKKLMTRLFRYAETDLIRQNQYIVSGSRSELEEAGKINPGVIAAYLPTAYAPVEKLSHPENLTPAVIHLGTLKATANRVGLMRFLTVCWTPLKKSWPEAQLVVIGSMEADSLSQLKPLLQQEGVSSLGFVADLEAVLKPYDIHVIPYEFDTGTRTRLSLALNYNQLLVAHRNACRGIDGLRHMENCLLAGSLEEMTSLITEVLAGKTDYKPIADRGRLLFDQAFTVEGQLPRMKSFLSAIFGQ